MAAKRLGSALTNIEGTSKQLLRVKEDESGFEFVAPASIPTYTITNETIDRVMNADDVTLDELADVLGTLIEDLAAAGLTAGGGVSSFTWSASEQVWPFEKDSSGNTLYCIEVDCGAMPNAGDKNVAHGISSLDCLKVFKLYGVSAHSTAVFQVSAANCGNDLQIYLDATYIRLHTVSDFSSLTSTKIRIIYAK